eukprot:gb/GECH01011527.1/.p1 GENE.gb/GECH01011527.1/~~gb/GECH01011527.1/.p1  ORF type:complete len:112 (+),score=21.38 gb/GECH01011527.1/:1-336(+)
MKTALYHSHPPHNIHTPSCMSSTEEMQKVVGSASHDIARHFRAHPVKETYQGDLTTDVESLQKENEELKKKNVDLTSQVENLNSRVETLEKEIERIKGTMRQEARRLSIAQ